MSSDGESGGWSFRIVRDDDERAYGRPADDAPDLSELLADYLANLAMRGRPETIRHARSSIERLVKGLKLNNLADVTKARISEWRKGRILGGASNRTANAEVTILVAALNHAVRFGRLEVNPLAGLPKLPTTARFRRRQARALSDEEIERLLAAAHTIDRQASRAHFPRSATLRGLLATGARWGELTHATWADLDIDRRDLVLRGETTKNSRTRRIPLDPSELAYILSLREHYVRARGDLPTAATRIFLTSTGVPWPECTGNFHRFLHEAMRIARIPRKDGSGRVLHVHALRHTAASRWARCGVPLLELQKLLGHSDPKLTSQVYIDAEFEVARRWILPLPGSPLSDIVPLDRGGEPSDHPPPSKRGFRAPE